MDSSSDVRAMLEKLHVEFFEAFKANDQAAIGQFYADNAIVLPPGRAMLSGREQIVAFWRRSKRILGLTFAITDLQMLGDAMVREAGTLQMTMRGQGRENRTVVAKYVSLWSKAGDSWQLNNSVWNGSGGAQGGGRRGRQGQGGGGGQGGGRGGRGGGGQGGGGQGRGGQGGRGQGGGGGQGGGRRQGQGGGQGGRGQGGRGQGGAGGQGGGGGRGQGGGQGGRGQGAGGARRGGGNEESGGLTPRSRKLRAIDDAPMVPRVT